MGRGGLKYNRPSFVEFWLMKIKIRRPVTVPAIILAAREKPKVRIIVAPVKRTIPRLSKSLLAIDPGTTESAYVLFSPQQKILEFGKVLNSELRDYVR
jgi:hypothetical protein